MVVPGAARGPAGRLIQVSCVTSRKQEPPLTADIVLCVCVYFKGSDFQFKSIGFLEGPWKTEIHRTVDTKHMLNTTTFNQPFTLIFSLDFLAAGASLQQTSSLTSRDL